MKRVRAKFTVSNILKDNYGNAVVKLWAVYKGDESSPENESFSNSTPAGTCELTITNPAAIEFFEKLANTYVYLDFTEAKRLDQPPSAMRRVPLVREMGGVCDGDGAATGVADVHGPGGAGGRVRYSVPASVTLAQCILESGWGQSRLAREANNFFGIKAEHLGQPDTYREFLTAEYVHGSARDAAGGVRMVSGRGGELCGLRSAAGDGTGSMRRRWRRRGRSGGIRAAVAGVRLLDQPDVCDGAATVDGGA